MRDDRTIPVLGGNDRQVWIAAIVLYGIGDTVTTLCGISIGGITEAGPIAGPLIEEYGRSGLIGVKAIVFPAFYVVWRLLKTPGRVAVPLALVLVGGIVTAWNLLVIASML